MLIRRHPYLLASSLASSLAAAGVLGVTTLAACGSSSASRTARPAPAAEQSRESATDDERVRCNIGMTECWRPGTSVERSHLLGTEERPVAIVCPSGDRACRRVRIEAVGDGDVLWDPTQSLVGLTCSLDDDGLTNRWSDGYYEGRLDDCSNGVSYDFRYVKVQPINAP